MPKSSPHFFETTVFEPSTGAEAAIISIPAIVLREQAPAWATDANNPYALLEYFGLRVGVRVPTPEDVPEVFFASLAGRVVPFDDFSFERWRTQRIQAGDDPRARFAVDLATTEYVTLEQSPLNGSTLYALARQGAVWTVGGWQFTSGHPLEGLGVVILGEFGLVLASVVRAFNDELYLAARYQFRRHIFRTPPDWRP